MTKPEFYFYHLERTTLTAVLPSLLEKTLAKGWRACLRFATQERLEAIDAALWTYRADSFLPHGTARDGNAGRQPIFLTTGAEAPNAPQALFLLEEAAPSLPLGLERVVRVFDGTDGAQLALARQEWKQAKANDHAVSYWRQDDGGSWRNAG